MPKTNKRTLPLILLLAIVAIVAVVTVNHEMRQREAEADIAALEAESAEKLKASADFIAAKAKEPGVQQIDTTGVYYKPLTTAKDTGRTPELQDRVNVTYRMQLPDGTVADERTEPVAMSPAGLIPGAREALLRMHVGDKWEIYIPQEQGYGAQGAGSIPPFSALVFTVEVTGFAE